MVVDGCDGAAIASYSTALGNGPLQTRLYLDWIVTICSCLSCLESVLALAVVCVFSVMWGILSGECHGVWNSVSRAEVQPWYVGEYLRWKCRALGLVPLFHITEGLVCVLLICCTARPHPNFTELCSSLLNSASVTVAPGRSGLTPILTSD